MITRLRYPKGYQFFDANGAPLSLGILYYYAAGTTTPLDTYSDSAGTVPNTNPIVLDGSGRLDVDVYLGSTSNYKEVLTTASTTIAPWPDDNIPLASQADWNAASGPNQILNKPVLAAVATSGSYTDLINTPSPFTGDSGSGGTSGLVPAPSAGDAVANKFLSASGGWATPPGASSSAATNLSVTETANSVAIGSSTGTGVTIPAATSTAAGVLDSARASKIDGLAAVATSGSYNDLTNKPSIPAIPGALSGQNIDGVARLGINTTDAANALSVNAPTVLFSNSGDMRAAISKGAAANTAAFNFQDNFNTRAKFGLLGNDNFTLSTSPDGSTFNTAIVASPSGAVSFPKTGGFTGDSGTGGTSGLVPAPAAGTSAAGAFLKADGTWSVPAGASSSPMTGATSSAAGTAGLVPAPSAGQQGSFLRGDATWQQMTAAQVSGLAPSATADTTNAANITSGALPAARLPAPTASSLGGVQSASAPANQFMTGINTSGVPQFAQPAAPNISGLGSLATLSAINNSNWSGTALAIANGGTGQTSAAAAFNSLSPMTAAGDLIYGGTGGAATRLTAGASSQVLIGGATPSWGAVNLNSMVTGSLSVANINATGTPSSTTYLRGDGTWSTPAGGGGGTPGGSSGQLQYNNSGAFGGAAALTYASSGTNLTVTPQNSGDIPLAVKGITIVGDGGGVVTNNKLVVNNSVNGSNTRQFAIGNGNWWTTAVPFFQPYTDNTGIALDIMPKGATIASGGADCWVDVCSSDITADGTNYETLKLWKKANGAGVLSTTHSGTGVARHLHLQVQGGGVSIGRDADPLSMLDVYGGLAVGSYATNNAAPSNGLIVSGNAGFGTASPQFPVDVNGIIASGYTSGGGELRSIQTAGGGFYVSLMTNTTTNKSGLYRSGYDFFVYYNTSTGDTFLNSVFGGGNIRFAYQGTEYGRMNSSGNWGIGAGFSSSAPTCQLDVNGPVRTRATTVSSLPSASTVGAGTRHFVTDATSTLTSGIGATVTGGGSNKVPVYSDGSSWLIG